MQVYVYLGDTQHTHTYATPSSGMESLQSIQIWVGGCFILLFPFFPRETLPVINFKVSKFGRRPRDSAGMLESETNQAGLERYYWPVLMDFERAWVNELTSFIESNFFPLKKKKTGRLWKFSEREKPWGLGCRFVVFLLGGFFFLSGINKCAVSCLLSVFDHRFTPETSTSIRWTPTQQEFSRTVSNH